MTSLTEKFAHILDAPTPAPPTKEATLEPVAAQQKASAVRPRLVQRRGLKKGRNILPIVGLVVTLLALSLLRCLPTIVGRFSRIFGIDRRGGSNRRCKPKFVPPSFDDDLDGGRYDEVIEGGVVDEAEGAPAAARALQEDPMFQYL